MQASSFFCVVLLATAASGLAAPPQVRPSKSAEQAAGSAAQNGSYAFAVAKLLATEGSLSEALAAFEEAEKLAPDAAYIRIEHAALLARMAQMARQQGAQVGFLRQAGEQVDRARQIAPDNLDVLRTAGAIYLDLAAQDTASLTAAEETLVEVNRRDPGDSQTALTLARIYLERKQPQKAAEVLRDLVGRAPQQRAAYALLVEALLRSDKNKEAEGVLTEILGFEPAALEARLTLAELETQRNDYRAALATLKAAPESASGDPRLRRQLAWAYYMTGDLESALAAVDPLLAAGAAGAAGSEDRQVALLKGLILSAQGRNEDAAELLGKLHESRVDDPALALVLSRVLERQGRREEAARVLSDLVANLGKQGKADEERQARLELAQVYYGAKDWDRLSATLAPLLRPGAAQEEVRLPALLLAADALVQKKNYDQALELLASGAPGAAGPQVTSKRAEVLFRAGHEREASKQLEELAKAGDPPAVLAAAQAYQRLEKYGDSIPLLQGLVARKSDSAPAGFLLGAAYERTGKRSEAVTEFRRVLGLDPDFHAALNYLGYMYAERGENLDEARSLVERAVALDPDNGAYVDSLGWVYFRLGRYEQARATLERATHLETADATVQEHLGDVYGALGQVERAEVAYRRALELGGNDPEKAKEVRRKLASLGEAARRP
ncbi:MAG TPA: tetratricopeptide repeat protein [Thermoanaerobaculia bacterium]|nr:tetratricopeptide repeat protein [Thermoanaerobaculia bacterium]